MWQTLIWDNQPSPRAPHRRQRVIWLYNLATGNSLSEFIGMIVTYGYTQGPGQAYAFGTLWEKGGIADCATVGVIYAALGFLSAAIVGVPVARWFVRKGLNANKTGASITKEFLTGIMDEKSTATNGRETTHASTIDTLAFHVALVGIVYLITYAELSWYGILAFGSNSKASAFIATLSAVASPMRNRGEYIYYSTDTARQEVFELAMSGLSIREISKRLESATAASSGTRKMFWRTNVTLCWN